MLLSDVQGENLGADKQRCQLRRQRGTCDINHMSGTSFPGTGDAEATLGLPEACISRLGEGITWIRRWRRKSNIELSFGYIVCPMLGNQLSSRRTSSALP